MSSDEQKPTMVDVLFMLGPRKAEVPKGARMVLDKIAKQVFPDVLQKPDGSYIFKYFDEEWKEWVEVQEKEYTILKKSKIRIECVPNESATEINKECVPNESATEINKGLNKEDASKSPKPEKFFADPIGEKPVTDVPGIGKELGLKLNKKGITFIHLLGKYLTLQGRHNKDKYFIEWFCMMTETNQRNNATTCFNALKDWTKKFINIDSN
ncbi:uncharacterized protein [Asterias amurensis]|uniref:uncharacterized protein n=1 Tax=Asterias amurensis TaxID=7602 RepID=UPI003AB2123F